MKRASSWWGFDSLREIIWGNIDKPLAYFNTVMTTNNYTRKLMKFLIRNILPRKFSLKVNYFCSNIAENLAWKYFSFTVDLKLQFFILEPWNASGVFVFPVAAYCDVVETRKSLFCQV